MDVVHQVGGQTANPGFDGWVQAVPSLVEDLLHPGNRNRTRENKGSHVGADAAQVLQCLDRTDLTGGGSQQGHRLACQGGWESQVLDEPLHGAAVAAVVFGGGQQDPGGRLDQVLSLLGGLRRALPREGEIGGREIDQVYLNLVPGAQLVDRQIQHPAGVISGTGAA